jgi:hypothetical protein
MGLMVDRAVLHSTEVDGQPVNSSRPRVSLMLSSLGGYNPPRLEVDGAYSSFKKNSAPGSFSSIRFSPIRQIQPQQPENMHDSRALDQRAPNANIFSNQSRSRQVHGKSRQVTPPFGLGELCLPLNLDDQF